jgi:hypothetical protein
MKRSYANARDVLPPGLLSQVQEHWIGMLWVPSPRTFYEDRKKLVLTLKAEGVSSREIAALAGVTPRRVNQILRAHGEKNDSSAAAPVNNP